MNILFILCEGVHDAQFIGRLLKANGYEEYKKTLSEYPFPLNNFIINKYTAESVDSVRIGRPYFPLVPACAFFHKDQEMLVLPTPLRGMDQHKVGVPLLRELSEDFEPGHLRRYKKSPIKKIALLFIYDADDRGIEPTIDLFKQPDRYGNFFEDLSSLNHAEWLVSKYFPIAIFVLTKESQPTGTLEDILIALFQQQNKELVETTNSMVNKHFQEQGEAKDLPYQSKKNKGVLTACGQNEKNTAGSSLNVIIRDTKLIDDNTLIDNQNRQWSQLIKLINTAFVS